jgi:hypothetical protein
MVGDEGDHSVRVRKGANNKSLSFQFRPAVFPKKSIRSRHLMVPHRPAIGNNHILDRVLRRTTAPLLDRFEVDFDAVR